MIWRPLPAIGLLAVATVAALAAASQTPAGQQAAPPPAPVEGTWELVVLGIAQDGGMPHLGCTQDLCQSMRDGRRKPERVSSLGLVNRLLGKAYLFDATPDLPSQVHSLTGGRMPNAIFLTHAHIGHYTGLMYLGRESVDATGVAVYATDRMTTFLRGSGPWSALVEKGNITPKLLVADRAVDLGDGIKVTALTVPHRDEFSDTVGFIIEGPNRKALYLPDIDQWPKWTRRIRDVANEVDLAFLDGTFASADEIPGRKIADIPHPLIPVTRELLQGVKARVRFIHLNHTNSQIDAPDVPGFRRFGPQQPMALQNPRNPGTRANPSGLRCDPRKSEYSSPGGSWMARTHRKSWRIAAAALAMLAVGTTGPWALLAQGPTLSKVKFATLSETDAREWLTYLASDALEGRRVFTEGYGLAAAFVAEKLRQFGVKPAGDAGYFQTVKLRSYKVARNSSVTVQVGTETRTFKHGDHVAFAANSGGKQTLSFTGVEFAGYGMINLAANHDDFRGREVKGRLVAWLPGSPAVQAAAGRGGGRGGGNRANYMVQSLGVAAVLSYVAAPPAPTASDEALIKAQAALAQANQAVADAQAAVAQAQRGGGGAGAGRAGGRGAAPGGRGGAQAAVVADINQTPYRVDGVVPPQITGDDTFWEFLLSASPTKFADLRARAIKGDALPPFSLADVKVTVNIDNTFEVLSTQLTKNVVGIVEGSDPKLKDTYVMFGAHLDHVGFQPTPPAPRANCRPAPADDAIFNGADDDGSGSTGLLGIAKAFATGPRPKRSVVFVWHSGEEAGLLGSHYNADFPVVPLDKVQAQFNIDMIGRNRDDNAAESSKVFVIGADRISTDLHNMVIDTNATFAKELDLDFEYNDPADPNSFYTRSDHYSYASKGIPIAFFFTGTHLDYHCVTDSVDRILFPKLVQIAQLVYQAGFSVANSDKTLERDNKGPRSGRGYHGRIDR